MPYRICMAVVPFDINPDEVILQIPSIDVGNVSDHAVGILNDVLKSVGEGAKNTEEEEEKEEEKEEEREREEEKDFKDGLKDKIDSAKDRLENINEDMAKEAEIEDEALSLINIDEFDDEKSSHESMLDNLEELLNNMEEGEEEGGEEEGGEEEGGEEEGGEEEGGGEQLDGLYTLDPICFELEIEIPELETDGLTFDLNLSGLANVYTINTEVSTSDNNNKTLPQELDIEFSGKEYSCSDFFDAVYYKSDIIGAVSNKYSDYYKAFSDTTRFKTELQKIDDALNTIDKLLKTEDLSFKAYIHGYSKQMVTTTLKLKTITTESSIYGEALRTIVNYDRKLADLIKNFNNSVLRTVGNFNEALRTYYKVLSIIADNDKNIVTTIIALNRIIIDITEINREIKKITAEMSILETSLEILKLKKELTKDKINELKDLLASFKATITGSKRIYDIHKLLMSKLKRLIEFTRNKFKHLGEDITEAVKDDYYSTHNLKLKLEEEKAKFEATKASYGLNLLKESASTYFELIDNYMQLLNEVYTITASAADIEANRYLVESLQNLLETKTQRIILLFNKYALRTSIYLRDSMLRATEMLSDAEIESEIIESYR